ncbi:MAG TPA: FAD-dependent oxidoreductase, partial [Chloroflexota bacterium]|nr:FAD-dependent oxidoreductase [Chloroflexota bacterium]
HHRVDHVRHEGGRVVALELSAPDGSVAVDVDRVISTMPLDELVLKMLPEPPLEVVSAARGLRYRSIITVNLMLPRKETVPDTWIYIHAPEVVAGRLQVYKNWSPAMVPNPEMSTLGLEYFADEGDQMWTQSNEALSEIARADLDRIGLAKSSEVFDGFVVRYPKAYPVYADAYLDKVSVLRSYLSQFCNLECAGRYGQFRYNNMDHSILTGMLAARKLCGEPCDPWTVNVDDDYHEEK